MIGKNIEDELSSAKLELNVSDEDFLTKIFEEIASTGDPDITLVDQRLSPKQLDRLCGHFKNHRTCQRLLLKNCALSDEDIYKIISALPATIFRLDLSNNHCGAKGARALADFIKYKDIFVSLENNNIKADEKNVLKDIMALYSKTTIQGLDQQISSESRHEEAPAGMSNRVENPFQIPVNQSSMANTDQPALVPPDSPIDPVQRVARGSAPENPYSHEIRGNSPVAPLKKTAPSVSKKRIAGETLAVLLGLSAVALGGATLAVALASKVSAVTALMCIGKVIASAGPALAALASLSTTTAVLATGGMGLLAIGAVCLIAYGIYRFHNRARADGQSKGCFNFGPSASLHQPQAPVINSSMVSPAPTA